MIEADTAPDVSSGAPVVFKNYNDPARLAQPTAVRSSISPMTEPSCRKAVAHLAVVATGIVVWVATPGAQMRWIDTERSTITVYVSASDAAPATTAHVIEAPVAEGSVEDGDAPHLALVINVDELQVVDPERAADERQTVRALMLGPKGLDAERYSRITYHSLTIDQLENGVWIIQGELELRGRFLPVNARAVRHGDRFTGTTTVLLTDFGVPPIPVPQTSAPVSSEVRVDFDIVLEAP
jgi:polyisoprenoid-binding protein YceI